MAFQLQEQLAHIAAIAKQSARMVQDFRSWPAPYWQRPTFCPGWTAADAVAHLATGSDFYTQTISAGRRGTPQLPWGISTAAEFREARAVVVKKLLDAGPAGLIAGFEHGGQQLQAVLDTLQEADLDRMAWHPRGLVPIGGWIGMRLTELGMHDWDIRQPYETPARLSSTLVPALLAILPAMQEQFLQQRLTAGCDGVYVMQSGQAAWGFTVVGTAVTCHAVAPASYDVCMRADAESMILLTMGRADVTASRQNGTLALEGDVEKGLQLGTLLFRAF